MPIDLQRILPKQQRRRRLVQIGHYRPGAEETLTKADEPFVGMDVKPCEIGELRQLNGFERCDFHDFSSLYQLAAKGRVESPAQAPEIIAEKTPERSPLFTAPVGGETIATQKIDLHDRQIVIELLVATSTHHCRYVLEDHQQALMPEGNLDGLLRPHPSGPFCNLVFMLSGV
jgi:hypothetical protein